jgi:beta-glucosidase
VLKAIDAGVDQFGGEACPELVVELVRAGRVREERVDESVRRLLRDKFRLGLFDDPYLDVEESVRIVGQPAFHAAGEEAQRRAVTLLVNRDGRLPLPEGTRLYVEGVDPAVAARYAAVVAAPDEADVALLRLKAPYEPRDGNLIESLFHAGDLDFKEPLLGHVLDVCGRVPTVVDVFLDRPAVMPEIAAESAALLASFGAVDAALLDIVFGRAAPGGRLPFELPSSLEAVRAQKEDVPADSPNPLFPLGHGLGYAARATGVRR